MNNIYDKEYPDFTIIELRNPNGKLSSLYFEGPAHAVLNDYWDEYECWGPFTDITILQNPNNYDLREIL